MEDPESLDGIVALVIYILVPTILLLIWWAVGRSVEKRHLASLALRESALSGILLDTRRTPADADPSFVPKLVTAEVAMASDGFKTWAFGLRNLFGGESRSFTVLYDRARREASVRLREAARNLGADVICNLRFDSADIGGAAAGAQGKKQRPMACCMASGTAYRRLPATAPDADA